MMWRWFRNRSAAMLHDNGLELSRKRLAQVVEALYDIRSEATGSRTEPRLKYARPVALRPVTPTGVGPSRMTIVHDISRNGLAWIDNRPAERGECFCVSVDVEDGEPIELLCTVRHCRRDGEKWIVGASFGVSALHTLSSQLYPSDLPPRRRTA